MLPIFKAVREIIAEGRFADLQQLELIKPETFNWVREVFEGINLAEHPDAEALIWTDGSRVQRFSFLEISKACNRFLNFLRRHQLNPQDILFMQLPLLPVNWLTHLVAIKGGFRLVPAATILGVQDIVYRFGKLLPKAVIADEENAVKIDEAEILSGSSIPLKIIATGSREGWVSLDETDKEPDVAEAADTRPDDILFLFFTSGTTGMPKVVIHTHFSYPIGHLTTASWIGLRTGDIHYNISQSGWAKFAWSSFFAPWNMGATIFAYQQLGRFNPDEQFRLLEDFRITTFCAPPTALRLLITADIAAYRLHLRECVAAGEPLNPEVIETWRKGTGLVLRDGYGQTESSCMVANLPGSSIRSGSMGKPTFLYDVVIADDEGKELPLDEEGNIAVRMDTGKSVGIFIDYFGDPGKKKDVFKYGLYYTGDKAYKDADGYLWFVGRDDDVIKASDYRIGPFEVESVLLEHESVLESAVVGSPHSLRGNEVKAFVILNSGYIAGPQLARELFAFARKNLAGYKFPRIIEFVPELPKTISGKIRRIELRAAEAEKKAKHIIGEQEYFYKE